MKLDFTCVGFAKCGTGTLYAILKKYQQVNLPISKEPRFFHWYKECDKPLEKLYKEYFKDVKTSQKIGIIDPNMTSGTASELAEYFGTDIKVIIMLRNPVKALYSDFRMGLRAFYWGYYYPFKKSTVNEKFQVFLDDCVNKRHNYEKLDFYKYDAYIDDILKNKNREDVMFILFEEFIKEPQKYKAELEAFIGLEPEDVDYKIWMNEGNKVSKNYFCARLNNFFLNIKNNSNIKIKVFGHKVLKTLHKVTLVENPEKMTPEIQKRCEDLYRESKNKVSTLIGRDLDGLWFK